MIEKSGMIDIGRKKKTKRLARARIFVCLGQELVNRIKQNTIPKGNVLASALIAGIAGAKKTAELIPFCHNIEIECVSIEFIFKTDAVLIESRVTALAKTGVEMEAMTACSIAALTVYDMCKMFSKSIEITGLCLVEKRGGKSGIYRKEQG
ncbi:MAG: cyclic pyranopterin monophosphate synthase MoaC [Candidatus Omnitrophota bacterium]